MYDGQTERSLKVSMTWNDIIMTSAEAIPTLPERAVRTIVVVIAGLVPHEAFYGPMIAIGKIHDVPPFGLYWAARLGLRYI